MAAEEPHASCKRPTSRAHPVDQVDRIFKALDSAPRRQILGMLAACCDSDEAGGCGADTSVCACVFAEKLDLTPPTVSHHMKVLIDAGLITAEKRGLWVHYQLRADGMRALVHELRTLGALGEEISP
jgi:ArsR family transcriptional regulator, arsenate/arsenite/antimonite-responsive transcriptional repressor